MIKSASKDVKAAVAWAGSDILVKFFTPHPDYDHQGHGQWVQHVSIYNASFFIYWRMYLIFYIFFMISLTYIKNNRLAYFRNAKLQEHLKIKIFLSFEQNCIYFHEFICHVTLLSTNRIDLILWLIRSDNFTHK